MTTGVPELAFFSGDDVVERTFRALSSGASCGVDLRYGGAGDDYGNDVTQPFDMAAVRVIAGCLADGAKVAWLKLDGHPITDAMFDVLLEGVSRNEHLDVLSLNGTDISSLGALRKVLVDNNSLTEVSFEKTAAAKDREGCAKLAWDLLINRQPLRVKYLLGRIRSLMETQARLPRSVRASADDAAAADSPPAKGSPLLPRTALSFRSPAKAVAAAAPPVAAAPATAAVAAVAASPDGDGDEKYERGRAAQSTHTLSTLELDDRGGSKKYDDATVTLVVATLVGCPPNSLQRLGGAAPTAPRLPPQAASRNTFITTLVLSHSTVTRAGLCLLAEYLKLDTCLVVLDLSHSGSLGPGGVEELARCLTPPGHNTAVEHVDLSYTGCGGERCGSVLAKMITARDNLSVLRLRGNDFRGCGKMFVKAQYVSTGLRVLDLQECGIEEEYLELMKESERLHETPHCVVVAIPKLHANAATLTRLDCSADLQSDSVLNDKSLLSLLEALQGNTCLQYLNLRGNAITYAGLCELATRLGPDAASGLTTLIMTEMRFQPNNAQQVEYGTKPVMRVCELLRAHPALAYVDLSRNYVEEDAASHALLVAKLEPRLLYFGLLDTAVPAHTLRRLSQILPLHRYPTPFAQLTLQAWECGVEHGVLDFSRDGPWWNGVAYDPAQPARSPEQEAEDELQLQLQLQLQLRSPTEELQRRRRASPLQLVSVEPVAEAPPLQYEGRSSVACVEEAVGILCEVLEDEQGVATVDMSGHRLGDEGAMPLIRLLGSSAHIVGLRLDNVGLTSAGALALADSVQQNNRVRSVSLEDNDDVSEEALAVLSAHLKFNATPASLKELLVRVEAHEVASIAVCGGEGKDESEELVDEWLCCIVDTVIAAARKRRTASPDAAEEVSGCAVQHVDFSHTFITNESLRHLTRLLNDEGSLSLQTINLRNCMISGTKHLSVFLEAAAQRSIQNVDLSHNYLGIPGFKAVQSALARYDTLGEVLLIGDEMIDHEKHAEVNRQLILCKELNRHPSFKLTVNRIRKGDYRVTEVKEANATHHLARLLCSVVHLARHLTTIDLCNGQMDDKGAQFLAKVLLIEPPVTSMLLSHNCITTVGARVLAGALEDTSNLQRLWLDHNKIDGRGATALTDALDINSSLTELHMEGNTAIPAVLMTKLADALINDQPYLKSLVPRIKNGDDDIGVLDFSSHWHNDLTLRRIVEAIPGNIIIHTINLSNSVVADESVKNISYIITSFLTLKCLILDSCGIDDEKATTIFKAVGQNQGLQRLSLCGNKITSGPIPTLEASIDVEGCGTLYEVNLEGNPCHGKGSGAALHELRRLLQYNSVPYTLKTLMNDLRDGKVTHLNLRGVERYSVHREDAGEESAEAAEGEPSRAGVTEPHGDKTAVILASVLPKCPVVQTVDLANNIVGDEGVTELTNVLLLCPHIVSVNLTNNTIGDVGLRALFRMVCSNYSLKQVLHSGNYYSDSALANKVNLLLRCNAYSFALKTHLLTGMEGGSAKSVVVDGRQVAELYEEHNRHVLRLLRETEPETLAKVQASHNIVPPRKLLDDEGVTILCTYMKRDPNVEEVVLPHHEITEHGVATLVEHVLHLENLRTIDLRENRIGDEGGILLAKLACKRPSLTHVDLSGNQCSDVTALQFIEHLKRPEVAAFFVGMVDNPAVTPACRHDLDLLLTLTYKTKELKSLVTELLDGERWISSVEVAGRSAGGLFDDRRGMSYTKQSAAFLLDFLKGCRTVKAVDISRNGFRDAAVLNGYMQAAVALRTFTVDDTQMDAAPLLRTLRHSVNLHVVSLMGCGIGDDCAALIAGIVGQNVVLRTLNLAENNLTDATVNAVRAAADAAEDLYSLEGVYVCPSNADVTEALVAGYTRVLLRPRVALAEPESDVDDTDEELGSIGGEAVDVEALL